MTRRPAALFAVVVAVLAGCGGGGNDGDEQVESTATSAGTASVAATTEPATSAAVTEPTAPATTVVVASSPPPTTVVEGVVPGTATITLLTQGAGLGPRPLLRWEAAEGAVSYVVGVNAPSGGPLWAWEGSVTEVPFGGGPADDPDTTGAQLIGPATWFVAALDAEGLVIATSAPADLAP